MRDMGGIFVPREIIESPQPWKPERMASGHYALDTTWKQDYVAIVSQGDVVDRNAERLGWSDRGAVLTPVQAGYTHWTEDALAEVAAAVEGLFR